MNPATVHDHGGHVPQPRRQHHYDVPDTPEAREHAEEAVTLKAELDALGVGAEQVSPSRDFRGHVRLNFDQLSMLLDLLDDREDEIAALKAQIHQEYEDELNQRLLDNE
jgi:hypothetical protein